MLVMSPTCHSKSPIPIYLPHLDELAEDFCCDKEL